MPSFLSRSILLLAALAFSPAAPVQGQDEEDDGRTLRWNELALQARLDAEGRLHVRERHAMVFDGAWNGGERSFDLRLGQELQLQGVTRIDPQTGARTPLERGDLDEIDHFERSGERIRWRSRAESDPPFRNQQLVYEIDYTLAPVLVGNDAGEYRLSHDFAFPDRSGVIERFSVELALDSVWAGAGTSVIRESAQQLEPQRGYRIALDLRYQGAGAPEAVARGAAPAVGATGALLHLRARGAAQPVRALVVGGALLVPLLVLLGLRRRQRQLDRIAPLTDPDTIDEAWLRSHIFAYPAEVVGTAWDRSVGEAEVAALLARLVAEGKLSSRVETEEKEPVLHLRRIAPLSTFSVPERELLEALFFEGRDETDTAAVREHYKKEGFDPAASIRAGLTAQLGTLPGMGKVRRNWLLAVAMLLAAVAVTLLLPGAPGSGAVKVIGLAVAAVAALIALPFAALLARRVAHRTGAAVGVMLPLIVAAALLALLAGGIFERPGGLFFYRPEASLLLSFLVVLGALGGTAVTLSGSTETAERLGFRRRLVSARQYFERELGRPEPRLDDAWFPYLLAFGLGSHVDRWFKSFGGTESGRSTVPLVVASGRSGGHHGGGWTGGGPQFGGGTFAGGGAGGAWGMAAAGMAAGVAAPSSGGGGGGVSVSGGGGGGGW